MWCGAVLCSERGWFLGAPSPPPGPLHPACSLLTTNLECCAVLPLPPLLQELALDAVQAVTVDHGAGGQREIDIK